MGAALLHAWICSPHLPWLSTIQGPHRSGADPADVRCQEHDGRLRPKTRALSYCCCCVPRTHVNMNDLVSEYQQYQEATAEGGRVRRGGGGGGLSLYNKPATTKPLSKETKPNYCNL